jgi:hypothetical protein
MKIERITLLAALLCLGMSAPTLAASKHASDKNKFNLVCPTSWKESGAYGSRLGEMVKEPEESGNEVDIFSIDLTEMKYIERSPQDENGAQELLDISGVSDDWIKLRNDNADDDGNEWIIWVNRKTGEYTYDHNKTINPGSFPWHNTYLDKTGTCTKAPFTPLDYVAPNRF